MAGLTALMLAVGGALGGRGGMTFALLMSLILNFFAYWFSDKMALMMSGAQEVGVNEAPELHGMVSLLAHKAGLPKPRVYIIPSETPNAFATGRNPSHSAIAVTEGILRILGRDELEGVLAHEMAHIKNRDILISSIAAVFAGTISHLANMAQWALFFGGARGDDEDENGVGILGSVVMMIVGPIAAMVIQMAISRSREYAADATGAKLCGRPLSLANALLTLERANHAYPMQVNPAQAQMYIVNPLVGGGLLSLFSTHPPVEARVTRLREMAASMSRF